MNEALLDPRSEQAIQLALEAKWDQALKLNLEIINDYPDDVDTLNRLGKAYTETGNISKAKSFYQKVLKLDPYNGIATNNLKRLSSVKAEDLKNLPSPVVNLDTFLEEPGKTKVIEVEDLAMTQLLATLKTGDPVDLKASKKDVTVVSSAGKRIGKLNNLWGEKIAEAINLGAEFSAVIKAVTIQKQSSVSVLIRETRRSPKLSQPIFPIDNSFTPYVREEALGLLSNQDPVQTESDESIEEVEIKDIPAANSSFDNLNHKEIEENGPGFNEMEEN
ncbi:MAG: tetratricopeptide repeat protein [bacterium]|nr:tetratricopeptide repeat protein [bacterium]